MLAMRDEEILVMTLIIGGIIVAGYFIKHWIQLRERKLRILEEALRNVQIDQHTKRELVQAFGSGEKGVQKLISAWVPRLVFVVGWIMLFAGVGTLLFGRHYDQEVGGIVAFVGFGVLSVPIALRELEARRQSARP